MRYMDWPERSSLFAGSLSEQESVGSLVKGKGLKQCNDVSLLPERLSGKSLKNTPKQKKNGRSRLNFIHRGSIHSIKVTKKYTMDPPPCSNI